MIGRDTILSLIGNEEKFTVKPGESARKQRDFVAVVENAIPSLDFYSAKNATTRTDIIEIFKGYYNDTYILP